MDQQGAGEFREYSSQGSGKSRGYSPQGAGPTREYSPQDSEPSREYTPQGAGPTREYSAQDSEPSREYTPQGSGSSREYTPQGFYASSHDHDHAMVPYLTESNLPRHDGHVPPMFSDNRPSLMGSTAVGKSNCFSTEPEAHPDEWRRKNPEEWSAMDVLHWIGSVASRCDKNFEDINAQAFRVSGAVLLSLSFQEFCQRDPQHGHLLYDALHNENPQYQNLEDEYMGDPIPSTSAQGPCYSDLNDNYSYPEEPKLETRDSESGPSDSEPEAPPPLPAPKIKRPPGRPPGAKAKAKAEKKTGRLWEFIRNLLHNPEYCPSAICWEDHDEGVFRFVKSEKVAKIWGKRKNNEKMNYEKLSRAMRYYYKSQVFLPVLGRKLVYKFGPNAKGWRSDNPNFRNPPPQPE